MELKPLNELEFENVSANLQESLKSRLTCQYGGHHGRENKK